ncbi:MAG: hypothetical protein ACK49N_09045 [Verrucomicrobiota bacterium]
MPTFDAFQMLCVEKRLGISAEELREAFREAGKRLHPDAGGGEGDFADLQRAHDILASPSRRLSHWLELRGTKIDPRGAVEDSLMDQFAGGGATMQTGEALIRKRDDAKSALGRALLEDETQRCREDLESMIARVNERIECECAAFPRYEGADPLDATEAARSVRNLAFLEKWQASLRAIFARML